MPVSNKSSSAGSSVKRLMISLWWGEVMAAEMSGEYFEFQKKNIYILVFKLPDFYCAKENKHSNYKKVV